MVYVETAGRRDEIAPGARTPLRGRPRSAPAAGAFRTLRMLSRAGQAAGHLAGTRSLFVGSVTPTSGWRDDSRLERLAEYRLTLDPLGLRVGLVGLGGIGFAVPSTWSRTLGDGGISLLIARAVS
jgi:hypothetical protein